MLLMIGPCAFCQRMNVDPDGDVTVVARKLFKNYSTLAFLDYSDNTIEWLREPAPGLRDIVLPLASNELRLISPKLRPFTNGIFVFGPGLQMRIFKGHGGKITIGGVEMHYDELKKAFFILEHDRARLNNEAEQDGTGQPATRPQSKSEGDDKPKP